MTFNLVGTATSLKPIYIYIHIYIYADLGVQWLSKKVTNLTLHVSSAKVLISAVVKIVFASLTLPITVVSGLVQDAIFLKRHSIKITLVFQDC